MTRKVQSIGKFDAEIFNAVNPIVRMHVYQNGCVVLERENQLKYKPPSTPRQKVQRFSSTSRARLALVAKETSIEFLSMATLTYGVNFPHSGIVVKNHLHKMLARMATAWGKFDYLWFFEFQKRGAPHVHLLCNLEPPTTEDRVHFSRLWADDILDLRHWRYSRLKDQKVLTDREVVRWFHQRPKQWEEIRHPDGAARYCVKYACKTIQKSPPTWFYDVGRFWGHTRRVGNINYDTVKTNENDVRKWLAKKRPSLNQSDVLPKILFDCFT